MALSFTRRPIAPRIPPILCAGRVAITRNKSFARANAVSSLAEKPGCRSRAFILPRRRRPGVDRLHYPRDAFIKCQRCRAAHFRV